MCFFINAHTQERNDKKNNINIMFFVLKKEKYILCLQRENEKYILFDLTKFKIMGTINETEINEIREWVKDYMDDFTFGEWGEGERTFEEIVDINGLDVYVEFVERVAYDWERHRQVAYNYLGVNLCSVSDNEGEWLADIDISDMERYEEETAEPTDLEMFGRVG